MCQIRERERESKEARCKGIPIGNLTSQIFSNIYLNELDRFVKHTLGIKTYLRYGDDFFIVTETEVGARQIRERIINFIVTKLRLSINPKHDILIPVKQGLKFLGVQIFSGGRRMSRRNWRRSVMQVRPGNISSYRGLVQQHGSRKKRKQFDWVMFESYDEI